MTTTSGGPASAPGGPQQSPPGTRTKAAQEWEYFGRGGFDWAPKTTT
jgi:hypothetical protein